MAEWQLRWAQLDLARQKETTEFIREWILFLKKSGYNGLMLYLEDRIRTASYPYPSPQESYSPEEIRELAAFAEAQGVELIPCVATLGHAERFLRHPELAGLAEIQEGMTGRFGGNAKKCFCPTAPGLFDFLGTYLREVAALFPSVFFHAGLDEFWDFNLCPRCRRTMPDCHAESLFFAGYVEKIRSILHSCGRKMMMWSDMFEYYPEAYRHISNEIILCDWQYQKDVRSYSGHFFDIGQEDRLAVSETYGRKTMIVPADRILSNSVSYFEYASDRSGVAGGLLSSWEKTDTFLYRSMPVFACFGHMMEGISREAAFAQGVQEIFGISDPVFVSALRLALSTRHLRHFEAVSERRLLTRDSEGLNYAEFEAERLALQILCSFQGREKGTAGKRCLRDCILTLREKCLAFRLHQCVQDSLDRGFDRAREAEYRKLVSEYDDFLAERAACFSEWRPGIEGNIFQLRRGEIMRNLGALAEKLSSGTFVRLRFCLPDAFGVEHCKVELFCTGSWEYTGEGVFKAHDTQTACFTAVLPASLNAVPEKVRLTCHGMGGTGIAYVEVVWKDAVFVPQAVAGQEGLVSNPGHLLDNDAKFAWFGGQSTREDYFSRNHADTAEHSLELSLARRNPEKLDLPDRS